MRLRSPWLPRLAESETSASDRLVTAMAEDILDGRLDSGDRLPAHRELADKLKIGLGTVTKAYGILERRGLIRSVKGAGTFVALVQTRRGPVIDVSRNTPPSVMTERLLARTLTSVAKRVDAGLFNDYPPVGGHAEHRRLLARWFLRLGMDADPERLLLTSGAHHAVSVAMSVACGYGGTLFTEAQTYPGAIALARHQGIRLIGVEMDKEGVIPQALDRALSTESTAKAALYVTPTMQNPTTASMSRQRREEVVSICRAHDIAIIEDDVYTLEGDDQVPPLAMLAPERTFYANSMSKTLNPTLRIGALVTPDSMFSQSEMALQATAVMVSPLSCAVMEQWLLDGTAESVSRSIQGESIRRLEMARSIFGSVMHEPADQGYHIWLPMPLSQAYDLERSANDLGVLITPPSSTAVNPQGALGGARICLGAPTMADLRTALTIIQSLAR
ncbi:HTH-type transcriptional regulator NorG [Pseudomonas fluorescens]|uniref:HTH-type transcriptional regulator NorG n=2 Tax=Pseudomonas fluorescens TaxID=294 RepID=A0A5E7SFJ4_PSEFL|nr:HTH-type transcriptional regulator NorG [Pseudomonas fluorescens]